MSITATRIREINLVCVPTTDQDRAIEFYEALGFEKRTDMAFGGAYRWVEVYPPAGHDRDRARPAARRRPGHADADRDHADHRRHRRHPRRDEGARGGCRRGGVADG